ncbi:hypothetical protein UlMin_027615 [Ulmus minor]
MLAPPACETTGKKLEQKQQQWLHRGWQATLTSEYMYFILLTVYQRYAYMKAICIFETHVLKSFSHKKVKNIFFEFKVSYLTSIKKEILFSKKLRTNWNILLFSITKPLRHLINKSLTSGSCQRCFRGHSGPVSTLSDKLLGDGPGKVLASGGEDDTVRLWSLSSSGKRGQRALKSTLYGHVKPIKLIFVAGHKTSLLTTISTDSMVRVCDTTIASSASRSSCCVGRTSIPGASVNMKCHESLLYVAAVNIAVVHQSKLYLFEALLSKSLICIGGIGSAMLWDIRRNQEPLKPEPIAEMDGHDRLVSYLHMDSYKIVTAGLEDSYVNVWDVDTGTQTNALSGSSLPGTSSNCSGVAVDGCRIVTTHYKL